MNNNNNNNNTKGLRANYSACDIVIKLSLMSWILCVLYLLLMLLYALVKVPEDPLTDFMCLVFTADATVCAGKGPGGSGDGTYTFQTLLRLESVLTTNSQILSDRFVIRAVHTSSEMYIV